MDSNGPRNFKNRSAKLKDQNGGLFFAICNLYLGAQMLNVYDVRQPFLHGKLPYLSKTAPSVDFRCNY